MDDDVFKSLLERGRLLLSLEEWSVSDDLWWKFEHLLDDPEADPGRRLDILFELPPGLGAPAVDLLHRRFNAKQFVLAHRYEYMAVRVTLAEFLHLVLPLSTWHNLLLKARKATVPGLRRAVTIYRTTADQPQGTVIDKEGQIGWLVTFLDHLLDDADHENDAEPDAVRVMELLDQMELDDEERPLSELLNNVAENRPATATVSRSRRTVKADAAYRVFEIDASPICWAVLDSGIDARHLAFRRRKRDDNELYAQPFTGQTNNTRVRLAVDFTGARDPAKAPPVGDILRKPFEAAMPAIALEGQRYEPPVNGHGSHVAGIIGGDGGSVTGVCPGIRFWDLRVLNHKGEGNEFAVLSALRFILDQNQKQRGDRRHNADNLKVHGVNLSLSLVADVSRAACGWTLVCQLCDELVRSGVVVVVSAGNTGFEDPSGRLMATGKEFRTLSITDPGNADRVITVGATHPDRPFEYGVSYFSARGPTADGRMKPDLVAPGQGIDSAFTKEGAGQGSHKETRVLDGTSQAAAHVSGVAALLMARHRELIGRPEEVKAILCETASDLGRDQAFQGHGMVDALRALQAR